MTSSPPFELLNSVLFTVALKLAELEDVVVFVATGCATVCAEDFETEG